MYKYSISGAAQNVSHLRTDREEAKIYEQFVNGAATFDDTAD